MFVEFAHAVDAFVPDREHFVADFLRLDFFHVGDAEGKIEGIAAGNQADFFGFGGRTRFHGFGAPGALFENDVVQADDGGFPGRTDQAGEDFFPIGAFEARGAADHQQVNEFFAEPLCEAGRKSLSR